MRPLKGFTLQWFSTSLYFPITRELKEYGQLSKTIQIPTETQDTLVGLPSLNLVMQLYYKYWPHHTCRNLCSM